MEDEKRETKKKMSANIKFKDDDIAGNHDDDDFFEEEERFFDSEEREYYGEEMEEMIQDWEKEAKRRVRIEMDDPSSARRRTIYELESYESSAGPSAADIRKLVKEEEEVEEKEEEEEEEQEKEPIRKVRYSVSVGVPGIVRIDLSPLTQKIIGCVIDENVTTEYPWMYARKDIIEDNLDLHAESSDFLPVKDEILTFPDSKILIGYAPTLIEKGQFYIALTVEGRDAIVRRIQIEREDHENRVKYAIYKTTGYWHNWGSDKEIEASIVHLARPLFEIEAVCTADALNKPLNLTDRKATDQRDGYVELLPYTHQIFENVWRKVYSRPTQVMPIPQDNKVQTTPSIPANSWIQYLYEYRTIDLSAYTEDKIDSFKYFLQRYTDDICDQLLMNSTWDIYTNDYANLVRSEKDTHPTMPVSYKEHQSYHDGKVTMDKVINDLAWHPFWTGVAIATYTQHAKSDRLIGPKAYDEVLLACEGDNRVLIWSFTDCLSPKLILECSREVTSITVCPFDGSVVIGGCANGQIVIWHIPGKLEQVEAVVTKTSAQARYSIAMRSLMTWMLDTTETSRISPTAMSSLKYSQKAGITRISWMPPHYKIDKNGRVISLPEDTPLDDLNWQIATASQDGTIAFWDLKWKPTEKDIREARGKRKKRKPHDNAKTKTASPFKIFDRVFKPYYILVVQHPDENRQVVITTLNMCKPTFRNVQVEPFPTRDDITIRKYYKTIVEKTDYAMMEPKILVGTVEGDFGCITWDGYEFATDVGVNRETARWLWIKRIHDGPITHSFRSHFYFNVVITVGGKIFAVWREDYGEPVFWRRSNVGYTACTWGKYRPVLVLGRMDGTLELWDLSIKSHEPSFTQSVSGRILTGIYVHQLPIEPHCVGFCDFTGSLRIFMAPRVLVKHDVSDIEWFKKFVDRQVQRMKEFKDWQEAWRETNPEHIEMKKKLREEKKSPGINEKIKTETTEAEIRATISTKPAARRKPWQFIEEAKERWMSMDVKRMQRLILEKKGLRKDVLERRREPLLRLRQEARTKNRKIREILNLQDRIFEETVVFLFPEQERKETLLLPPLSPVPSVTERPTDDELVKEAPAFEPEEEIIYNFLEVQAEALAKLKTTPFKRMFDWRTVLAEGKSRRRSMDIELVKLNKPKKMCKVDGSASDISHVSTIQDTQKSEIEVAGKKN